MITSYSSIYDLKTFMLSSLVPKYFDTSLTSDLNVGLLGYTSELVASVTDDTFNTVATYMNEMFPNLAILPESIYNYGALFQLGQEFATPSQMTAFLFISEDDVIRYMTRESNRSDISTFYIDSDMIIDVEGIQFMLDYDIKISVKPWIDKTKNEYIFTAEYIKKLHNTDYINNIATVTSDSNPYIKIARITYSDTKYLALMVTVQQVNKFTRNENVINNDILTPVFNVPFDNKLANFEIFYKAPNSSSYKQLKKRMVGTTPIKEDFCYYRLINENELEISFSMRDTYFQPEFNSDIIINYYTTIGEAGNFEQYTGNDIIVQPSSVKYVYNNNISMFAVTQSASQYGADNIDLEELKNITVESFSTVKSYTTENDLMMYFDNFNTIHNTRILFIKRRDDIFERLFSSFTIYESNNGDIFSTNTLNLQIPMPDDGNSTPFDVEKEQDNLYVIKPGRIFTYKPNILDTAIMKSDHFIYDGEYVVNEDGETEYKYDVDLDNVVPDIYYDQSYTYKNTVNYSSGAVVFIVEKNDNDTVELFNPGTSYSKNDIVLYNNALYEYNKDDAHVITESEFYNNFIQVININLYHIDKKYFIDDLMYIENKIYRCIADTNVGEFDSRYWVEFATKKVCRCISSHSGNFDKSNWVNIAEDFVYTNPYMIYLAKDPIVVGYYLNTVNKRYPVDYYNDYFNSEETSYLQFICNSLKITRDAIRGENCYTVTIMLTPTSTFTENPLVAIDKFGNNIITDNLFIELAIANENDDDLAYSLSPNPNKPYNGCHLGYVDSDDGYELILLDDAIKNDDPTTVRTDIVAFEDVLDDGKPVQYVFTDNLNYSWEEITVDNESKINSSLPVIYYPDDHPRPGDYESGQVYRKVTDDTIIEWVCVNSNPGLNIYEWVLVNEETYNEIARNPDDYNEYYYDIIYGIEEPINISAKKGQVYKRFIPGDNDILFVYVPNYRWELVNKESEKYIAYNDDGSLKYNIKYSEVDDPNDFDIGEIIRGEPGQIYQRVKIIDRKDDNVCRMYLDSFDLENNIYTFVGKIKTNDNIEVKTSVTSSYNKFEITNMYSQDDGIIESILAPMTNCILKIWTWYKPNVNSKYICTNEYRTSTNKVTFIHPINMMRSYAKYEDYTYTSYVDNSGNINKEYLDENGNPTYTLYAKLYNVLEGYLNPNDINVEGELGQLYKITNPVRVRYKDDLLNTITETIGTEYTFYQCINVSSNMRSSKKYEWVEVYKTITDSLNINPNNYYTEIPGTLNEYYERPYNGTTLIYQCTKESTADTWAEWTLVDNIIRVDTIPNKSTVAEYGIGQLARMYSIETDKNGDEIYSYKYYRCSNAFTDNTKKIAMDPYEPDEYLYPVIKGSLEPTDDIIGEIGQVYQFNDDRWVCTEINDVYTWESVTEENCDKIAKDPDDPTKYKYDITYNEGEPHTTTKGIVGQVYNSIDDIGWVCMRTSPRYYWEKVTDLNTYKISIDPHRSDIYAHNIRYGIGDPQISTKGFIGQVYQSIIKEWVCIDIDPIKYKWERLNDDNRYLMYKGEEEYGLYAAPLVGPNPLTDIGDIIGKVFIEDKKSPKNSSGRVYTSAALHPDELRYPIRTGGGDPTDSTEGNIGQLYRSVDDDNGMFICTEIEPIKYTWEELTEDNKYKIAIDPNSNENIYPTNYCLYEPTIETEGRIGQVHSMICDTEWVCYDITLDKYEWELINEDNIDNIAVDENGEYIFDTIYVKGDEPPTDYTKGIVGQVYKLIGDTEWVCTDFRTVYTWEKVNANNGVTEYTWTYFGEMDLDTDILTYIGVDFNSITKSVDMRYGYYIHTVPFIKASTMRDKELSDEFYSYLYAQYDYISGIIYQITNNYGIDMKFYNTYGKSKNFYIGDDGNELLNRVDIKLYIKISPMYVGEEYEKELVRDIKLYIKNYIESINNAGTNSIYISNLIQSLENDFEEIKYMKWVRFNDYDPSYQVIENKTIDLSTLAKDDRLNYTPEYLTISYDDINIEII